MEQGLTASFKVDYRRARWRAPAQHRQKRWRSARPGHFHLEVIAVADDGDGVVLAIMAGAKCGTAEASDEMPTRAAASPALNRLASVDPCVPQIVVLLIRLLGVSGAGTAPDPGEAVVVEHEAFAEFVKGVAQVLGVQATPSIDLLCRRAADGVSVEMPCK